MNNKKDMFKPSILYMTDKEMLEYFKKSYEEYNKREQKASK